MEASNKLASQGRINQNASLRDKQAVIVNAGIDKIWEILIDFSKWNEWNDQIKPVKIDKVEEGAQFVLKLNGSTIKSSIQKISKPELLTWTGVNKGLKSIHIWRLEETDGNQTIVTTEESMQGFFTIFAGHRKLHETLVYWLNKLKEEAEK
ncbi:MAG: SRPBCC domain-containing protein [Cyclobacteriaceae bacterium]